MAINISKHSVDDSAPTELFEPTEETIAARVAREILTNQTPYHLGQHMGSDRYIVQTTLTNLGLETGLPIRKFLGKVNFAYRVYVELEREYLEHLATQEELFTSHVDSYMNG